MIKGIYPSQVKSYPLIKIGIGPFYLVTHQARLVMNRPNYEKNCCSWFPFIDYLIIIEELILVQNLIYSI